MGMDTQTTPTPAHTPQSPTTTLTDINGLRLSGIFPNGKDPSIRTLRSWTQCRRIPHHRLGHFVYYDIAKVALHIRTKLFVPPRG